LATVQLLLLEKTGWVSSVCAADIRSFLFPVLLDIRISVTFGNVDVH